MWRCVGKIISLYSYLASIDIIFITDLDGVINYVNPAFETVTGYQSQEAVGCTPNLLRSGKHDKAFYNKLWNTICGGDVWAGDLINKCKDGTLYESVASISPVFDSEGKSVNFVAVCRDVTEERLLQPQPVQAQKMEAIGTLAGGIAHDFNNILSALIGYNELARECMDDKSKAYGYLSKVDVSLERARELVQQILMFSRRKKMERQPLRFCSLIDESMGLLRSSIPATIEIGTRIDQQSGTVLANRTELHQIVMNLCTNAFQAMRETGGKLEISLELVVDPAVLPPTLAAGDYLCLCIADNGPGIDPSILNRIYEPYFTTKGGGELTGESELGYGSKFSVYIPQYAGDEVAVAERTVDDWWQ